MKQCQEADTHLPQNGIRKAESGGHVDSTVAAGSVRL